MTEFNAANMDWDQLSIDPNEAAGPIAGTYQPQLSFPPAPALGRAVVAGVDGTLVWGRDGAGNLYFRGQFQVVGGEDDGKKVTGFVSSRILSFRPDSSSEMDDFIYAGTQQLPKTKGEIVEIVNRTFTLPRKVQLNREGYCRDCAKTVAKGKAAPKRKDGSPVFIKDTEVPIIGFEQDGEVKQVVTCPICGAAVAGRGIVSRWYAA